MDNKSMQLILELDQLKTVYRKSYIAHNAFIQTYSSDIYKWMLAQLDAALKEGWINHSNNKDEN